MRNTYKNTLYKSKKHLAEVIFMAFNGFCRMEFPRDVLWSGEDAIATGWGRLAAKGNFAKILQKVDLKVKSKNFAVHGFKNE